MHQNVRIFVEGKEDKYFLESYIEYLGCYGSVLEMKCIGGWQKIKGHCPTIERRLDAGERILIIFDTDGDYRKRKLEIEEIIETETRGRISRQNSDLDIFLLPNNQLPGEIEDLLEKIVRPEHKKIFDCFESYKKCLKGKNASYQPPNIKGKIYSYKQALGIMEENKENHFKPRYWDFQNSFLVPLKIFLLEGLS